MNTPSAYSLKFYSEAALSDLDAQQDERTEVGRATIAMVKAEHKRRLQDVARFRAVKTPLGRTRLVRMA